MIDLRLLLPACSGWASSWIATSTQIADTTKIWLLAVGITAMIGLTWSWILRHRLEPPKHALTPGGSIRLALVLAFAVATCTGLTGADALAQHRRDVVTRAVEEFPGAPVTMRIRLTQDPAPIRTSFSQGHFGANARILNVTTVDETTGHSGAMIWAQGQGWAKYARGDELLIRGSVDTGFHADPPYVGSIRVQSSQLLHRPDGWTAWVRHIRHSLVQACASLSDQGKALVPGMAVGDDRQMNRELEDAMRTASLTHLVAISGSHIAIILAVLAHLLPGNRLIKALATLVVLATIVALVGPQASVLRSVSVATVGVAGLLLHRSGQSMAALGAVVIAFLLIDPWSARSYGFALSVVATVAVVGPAAAISRWATTHLRSDTVGGRICQKALGALSIPACCQLFVLPLLLVLDDKAPLWGVCANILAAPAVAPATILALTAALVSPLSLSAGQLLASASSLFTGWIAGVAQYVAQWPAATVPIPGGARGVVVGFVVAAGVWLAWKEGMRMRNRNRNRNRSEAWIGGEGVRPPTNTDSHTS